MKTFLCDVFGCGTSQKVWHFEGRPVNPEVGRPTLKKFDLCEKHLKEKGLA
jgi:hypothetical protein